MTVETQYDPKGLIADSFRIEGITPSQCRSIFLDWALSLPDGVAAPEAIPELLSIYADGASDHPMTEVLKQGLTQIGSAKRRGGRKARVSD